MWPHPTGVVEPVWLWAFVVGTRSSRVVAATRIVGSLSMSKEKINLPSNPTLLERAGLKLQDLQNPQFRTPWYLKKSNAACM